MEVGLREPAKFIGFNLDENQELTEFLLENNGLKILFQLYEGGGIHPEIGQFKDLIVESAITNIVDFEDAVAIVDAEDMVVGLRNYPGVDPRETCMPTVLGEIQRPSIRTRLAWTHLAARKPLRVPA